MIALAAPTEQPLSSMLAFPTQKAQSVTSTAQTPKANQSAWNCFRPRPRHPAEANSNPEETTHSTASKILEVYSSGSRHPRGETAEGREVPVQPKKAAALIADVAAAAAAAAAGIPARETEEATSPNRLQTESTVTCRARTRARPPADGDLGAEKPDEGPARGESEAGETDLRETEGTRTGIDW